MNAIHCDRRKNVRYAGHRNVILLQPSGIHQIRDISFGGLSFRCPPEVVLAAQWPLEIMVAGSLLRVIRLPVRLVRELVDDSAGPALSPGKEVGVEFLAFDRKNRPLLARLFSYLQQTADCGSCK